MYIAYRTSNGQTYAFLAEAVRNGKTVKKNYLVNLGRVLDKEKGIYRSRERGVYTYDLESNSYGKVPVDYIEPSKSKPSKYLVAGGKKRSRLCIEFGDSFFLDAFLKETGLYQVIDAAGYGNKDTLHAIVFYYLLSQQPNSHAADWYELSYAKYLFPNATMSSQRISDALAEIGMEDSKRLFFGAYYPYMHGLTVPQPKQDFGLADPGDTGEGILIDSTGLPNSAHLPITAVSNHNGEIHNEVRLIYVVQQKTGLPLFFSYVAGNVIDASTVKHVVAHLRKNGIDTNFAVLDAGYYNSRNADALMDAKISFITRVHTNNRVFTEAVNSYRASLECRDNFVTYNGRFYYIKRTSCKIGQKSDRDAYAYLCLDVAMRDQQKSGLRARIGDQKLSDGEVYDNMYSYGLFVLVATRPITPDKVLTLYYTRNQIEAVFRVDKSFGKLLPLRTATEETFRGHLLITFIVSVILNLLQVRLKNTGISSSAMFEELRHQQGIVYEDAIVPSIAVKKMNDIYKLFKFKCPDEVPFMEELPPNL